MKQCWMRMAAAVIALVMMLTMFPLWPESAKAENQVGTVTADGVFLRKQPGSSSYWFKLPKDFTCTVLGTETKKGVLWYKVRSNHPESSTTNTYIGYIHSDFFTLDAAVTTAPDTGDTTVSSPEDEEDKDSTSTTTVLGEVKGAEKVNFRKEPVVADDNIYQTLPEGTLVQVLEVPEKMDSDHWVKVLYDGKEGYIMASYLTLSTVTEGGSGTDAEDKNDASTDNSGTADGTTDGTTGGTTDSVTSITVGEVNADSVNFRKTENGALIEKLKKGTRVEILTIPAGFTSSYWFKVAYDGKTGYIQAPFVTILGTTSGSVNDFGSVKLILSSANLRAAPGGKILTVWSNPGETLPVTGPSQAQGGYTWYPVLYQGSYYFVRNDCVLLMSGINSGASDDSTITATFKGYLKTIKSGVNLRSQPSGKVIEQVKKGTVIKQMSDAVSADGYTWYLVEVDGTRGYMRSDCVTFVNEDGSATDAPAVTTPPADNTTTSTYGYVITVKPGVNLRAKPAGSSLTQISQGVILPMTGYSVKSGKYIWYPVRTTDGLTGYVRGDCVSYCTSDGTATTEPNEGEGNVTTAPSVTGYGYVMIKSNSVNVRKTPGGSSLGHVDKNTVWPMTGYSTTSGGYTWYPINANGLTGYVRGDHSFKLSASQEQSYLAGNGVPSEDGSGTATVTTQYVQTVLNDVYLRASASKDADHPYQVETGTVMAFDLKQTVGGSVWYRVIYDNKQVWVLGDCVKVMTEQEYKDYIASNPAKTPQTEIILGYVKTTTTKVNVRTTAGGSSKLGQIDKDLVMAYSAVETAKGYTWYYASTSLGRGYLRSDCVVVCDKDGNTVSSDSGTGDSTGGSTSGQEATYTTLKKGSKGTAVKNLVTELKNQGYYTGEITSTYTTAVYEAVKAFQKANGLDVDGIAGSQTQHKLYGTVPVGSVNSSDLSFTIYPAEKIEWDSMKNIWKKGASYKIYDVKTGIVWWAKRWSGAYHADIEPLTAADTARLCKIYGVNTAAEIASNNLWQRRPCLVTINGHTYAASLYGVPHNYPDGDTIPDNNLEGQICLHFTNSKIHGSGVVDEDHQAAIETAYQYAKNGDPR